MKHWSLAFISTSVLALSACSSMPWSDDTPAAPAASTSAPALSGDAMSQEEKELATLMGEKAVIEPVTSEPTGLIATPADAGLAAPQVAEVKQAPALTGDVPDSCPEVEVLPDTKSITYFEDKNGKPTTSMTARAALTDIKGGCDYTENGVNVDIDMIMHGKIGDAGRYEGHKDLEAFMTFPYFVAVMDPAGKMIDKKIMATAMRFQPNVNDLDHAEKITQFIPLTDVSQGNKYTITVGYQLNRQQLEYNRGEGGKPTALSDISTAKDAKGIEKKPETKKAVAESAKPAASNAAPAASSKATDSAPGKMTPITE